MTVPSGISKVDYSGNDVTVAFSSGFRFLQNADLLVTLVVDATGVETTQVLDTDYTVTGAGDATGTVTMTTAPATGETLIISRDMTLTQEVDYVENDKFPAETHETALDKLTMVAQQLEEEQSRSLSVPLSVTGVSLELPSPGSLKYLRWNVAADAIENADGTVSSAASVSFTPAGSIAATDVQAAIVELDTEKEPADATILKDADIGVTVQGFDADTLKADTSDNITVGFTTDVPAATFATNFTPDVTASQMQTLPVTGALTIDEVLDGNEGVVAFKLEVDGSGPYSLNRNTNVQFKGTEVTSLSASTNYTMTVEKYDATTTVIQVLEIKSA